MSGDGWIARPSALDPSPEYARLRSRCPVAPVTMPSGDPAYLVAGYDEVQVISFGTGSSAMGIPPGAIRDPLDWGVSRWLWRS